MVELCRRYKAGVKIERKVTMWGVSVLCENAG